MYVKLLVLKGCILLAPKSATLANQGSKVARKHSSTISNLVTPASTPSPVSGCITTTLANSTEPGVNTLGDPVAAGKITENLRSGHQRPAAHASPDTTMSQSQNPGMKPLLVNRLKFLKTVFAAANKAAQKVPISASSDAAPGGSERTTNPCEYYLHNKKFNHKSRCGKKPLLIIVSVISFS
jgi:hypothetical protein